MAKSSSKKPGTKVLPLIPLAPPLAVLPSTTLKIAITNRSDVAAILAKIYSISPSARPDAAITVACVPLNSPLVSPKDGKRLIESDFETQSKAKNEPRYEREPVNATQRDVFGYACTAKVSGVQGRRQGELSLVVEGLERVRVVNVLQDRPYFEAELESVEDHVDITNPELLEQFNLLKQLSRELLALVRLSSILPRTPTVSLSPIVARRLELYIARKVLSEAGSLADFMANVVECTHEEKLRVLSAIDVKDRVDIVIEILQKQISGIQGSTRMVVASTLPAAMPMATFDLDYLRRIQQEALQRRNKLGGPGAPGFPGGFPGGGPGGGVNVGDDETNEIEELKQRLQDAKLSPEANRVAQRELQRLQKMNPSQGEYQVCRNYLENLAEIPWTKTTADQLNASTLVKAKKQLDDDHYGLDKIKKRLLEYLAVMKLKEQANRSIDDQIRALGDTAHPTQEANEEAKELQEKQSQESSKEELRLLERKRMVDKSPILLLVGPPGTGKTSLAKSIATALGRQFHRISLGGVRDEAEIRGHRRTYVAAMPGLLVDGLKKVGVANPVFLLDEIDKLGLSSIHGDPSAAMLEVLDPEQNHTFVDHYISIPIDLSKVLFIATANTLEDIPPPLLDRMETIELAGYTTLEKRHIASRHLIPKQIVTNGMLKEDVNIPTDVLDKIITSYTRESGVRNLEREIGSVCRSKAVEYATAKDTDTLAAYNRNVTLTDLDAILGIEKFTEELTEQHSRPGVVTGLVAFSTGGQGSILFIEVADMPGTGSVQLTGTLGDVLKESVEVALSWVKAHAFELGLAASEDEDIMKNRSIHVHCPTGATPKDGPSAGLAHTTALVSLFSGKPVPPTLAMTGEVSLRGRVLPVGGIKQKLIGALRAGVERVLLPEGNRKDVKDLPEEVLRGIKIEFVGHIWEGLQLVWPERWERPIGGWESRL